jgi:hypothetical protein
MELQCPPTNVSIQHLLDEAFIAVVAMQMVVESNRLNLDTDINQYLPPSMTIV